MLLQAAEEKATHSPCNHNSLDPGGAPVAAFLVFKISPEVKHLATCLCPPNLTFFHVFFCGPARSAACCEIQSSTL
eukprot:g80986.t1